jgi:hypothetical protein
LIGGLIRILKYEFDVDGRPIAALLIGEVGVCFMGPRRRREGVRRLLRTLIGFVPGQASQSMFIKM